ncbi:MAG: twin-arginine translocase subunit TatC [Candidatus Geothermincolia bacterium]
MADSRMSIFQHLEELRRRIIVAFLALGCAIVIGYIYAWPILDVLKRPAVTQGIQMDLYYMTVLEPFMLKFKIALYAGLALALPVILYEIMAFVAPAMQKKQKRVMIGSLVLIFGFFIAGLVFCYYFIMPLGISWLVNQSAGRINPVLSATSYATLSAWFLLALGLVFETPLLVFLVVRLGIVDAKTLHRNWRWAVISTAAFAALITPDWNPVTMIMVAVPMFALYEGSVLLAGMKRKKVQEAKGTLQDRLWDAWLGKTNQDDDKEPMGD